MRLQNLNAIRERIRQVELELVRLRMAERLAKMQAKVASRRERGRRGQG